MSYVLWDREARRVLTGTGYHVETYEELSTRVAIKTARLVTLAT